MTVMLAGAGASHGQTPVLQTGGVSTNVVAVLVQPFVFKENERLSIHLTWRATSGHGFGIIRFSPDNQSDAGEGPSLFFTANGFAKMLQPGENPSRHDLANRLDGDGLYALQFYAYLAANGVSLVGDLNAAWPGVRLSHSDFQSAQLILCGKGLEVVLLSHRTALTGTLFLVR
jgi:hypothetical protein